MCCGGKSDFQKGGGGQRGLLEEGDEEDKEQNLFKQQMKKHTPIFNLFKISDSKNRNKNFTKQVVLYHFSYCIVFEDESMWELFVQRLMFAIV